MKQPKYHNKKTVYKGEKFDSKKERNRWRELQLLEKNGDIYDLCRQVKFELIPSQHDLRTGKVIERPVHYIADFMYKQNRPEGGIKTVVEDTKGFKTADYVIKRKLMLFLKGIQIVEL